ncbi:MAG: adenine phosphoribosyltransferase [Planctomycetes bacterium SM23_32]|nr:MAG: adenine phosphoribosyltransferase [Planctomycetes bacterium SM23_32]
MDLSSYIRSIPDWPKPGIVFRDITTLCREPDALRAAVDALAAPFEGEQIDLVLAAEARGFIFGGAVASRLGAGFVPVRKPGKLPAETIERSYELEYGVDTLAVHRDAIRPGDRVLVLDDLLATGGTVKACCELVEELGGEVVACAFLIELSALGGREKLAGRRVVALIDYPTEE